MNRAPINGPGSWRTPYRNMNFPSPKRFAWAAADLLDAEFDRLKVKSSDKGGLNESDRNFVLGVFLNMQKLQKTRIESKIKENQLKSREEGSGSGGNNQPVGSPVGIADDPKNLSSDALTRMARLPGADGILTGSE